MLKHTQTHDIVKEIKDTVKGAVFIGYHPRITQDIGPIEIDRYVYHERDTMNSSMFLTFEMSQKIDGSNHHEIDRGIPEKAESLSEAPLATVADVGHQAYKEVHAKEQYQAEYIVPDRKQQANNVRQQGGNYNFQAIHNILSSIRCRHKALPLQKAMANDMNDFAASYRSNML